jgi:nucleoside-diphosphate-sugar epimerase
MKVLIIGGTGNISTATTRTLVARGDEVTLYNRGQTQVEIPGPCRTLTGDRYDHAAFEAQITEAGTFDCVIDMIGYAPQDLESAVRAFGGRVAQYIFCSTVDVYTKRPKVYPVTQDTEREPYPSFPYAYKKAQCERILEAAHARGDFALTILRPAQTYSDSRTPLPLIGPGTHFMRRVRQGKPILILGDGTSLWVASHRDDVGPAFAVAAGNPVTYGKSYDVTGDEVMTWERHYTTVAEVMGAPPLDLVRIPSDLLGRMAPQAAEWCVENFHYNNLFDNAAAKADLGYRYTITWEEGVRRMVAWHDARAEIDDSPDYALYDQIVSAWRRHSEELVSEFRQTGESGPDA